jgi:hypothetical protein
LHGSQTSNEGGTGVRKLDIDDRITIMVCSQERDMEAACKRLNVGSNWLNNRLNQLERKGLLTRRRHMPLVIRNDPEKQPSTPCPDDPEKTEEES